MPNIRTISRTRAIAELVSALPKLSFAALSDLMDALSTSEEVPYCTRGDAFFVVADVGIDEDDEEG